MQPAVLSEGGAYSQFSTVLACMAG